MSRTIKNLRTTGLGVAISALAVGGLALVVSLPGRTSETSFGGGSDGARDEERTVLAKRRLLASPGTDPAATPGPAGKDDSSASGEGVEGPAFESPRDESWRDGLLSTDASERRQAIDLMPRGPSAESRRLLGEILQGDEDEYVRERAVFALAESFGREAVARLKQLALTDPAPAVRAAAMASLHRIDRMDPLPVRGRLDVDCPERFDAAGVFEMTARLASVEDSPRAILEVMLPEGLELVSPGSRLWKGSLVAGRTEEIRFEIRIADPALDAAKIRVHLKVDYAGRLDAELLDREVRLRIDSGKGRAVVPESPETHERKIVLD